MCSNMWHTKVKQREALRKSAKGSQETKKENTINFYEVNILIVMTHVTELCGAGSTLHN